MCNSSELFTILFQENTASLKYKMCICKLFPCAISVFSGLFSDKTVLKLKSKLCLIQGRVKNFFWGLKYTDTYFVFIWELKCNWSYEDFVKRDGLLKDVRVNGCILFPKWKCEFLSIHLCLTIKLPITQSTTTHVKYRCKKMDFRRYHMISEIFLTNDYRTGRRHQ